MMCCALELLLLKLLAISANSESYMHHSNVIDNS